jgi:hypothetical protein
MGFKSYKSIGSQGLISASFKNRLKINTFLSNGTLKIHIQTIVNYLIVAGGGGSGELNDYATGGAGGGGVLIGSMTLNPGTYNIVVGDGGIPGVNNADPKLKNGKNSSFNGLVAIGGGGGAGGSGNAYSANSSGGSGGGGSSFAYYAGASGTDGQGNAGSAGVRGQGYQGGVGGGGGGASEIAGDALTLQSGGFGGKGGDGILVNSTNLPGYNKNSYFGGGGGGGNSQGIGGVGGLGGGGQGGGNAIANTAGKPNTGGGAGGYRVGQALSGGTGIVILTYIPPQPLPSANGIYGVKLLNDEYTGAIFNIRRGSDNATDDFFYTNSTLTNSSGTTLTTFLSGSIAYITIWYDQSSKGNNGTQNNPTLQPIYDPINLYVDFKPNRNFSLPDGTVPFGNLNYTVAIKHNSIGNGGTWLCSGTYTTNQNNCFRTNGAQYFNYWFGYGFNSGTYAVGNNVIFQYDGTTVSCYVNSQFNASNTPGVLRKSTNIDNFIGARPGNAEPLNGELYYMYIYDSALSSVQRSQIEL